MLAKILKIAILAIMFLNGLFFASNIYVLGNREKAIKMHDDLAPIASAFMANTKVIVCFITGILYIIAAFGIIGKNRYLTFAGIIAFILFDGLYLIELMMWSRVHPRIWIDFSIFGGISLILGVFSWWNLMKISQSISHF